MTAGGVKLLGVVIAGGLSRRMGDRDKLWLDLQGEPLIARAARRLARQTGDVVLNVNRYDKRLDEIGLPVVADLNEDYQGPLAGIVAALRWVHENRPDVTHVVAVSVDSPFFPDDLVSRLTADLDARPDEIAIAFSEDYPQPVFGLWPIACLAPLNGFLDDTDNLKVMAFVRSQPWRRVEFPTGSPPAFFNINTPDDLATAQGLLEEEGARG
jgi:molybdopterin-guanine dinucleotide biosynthesis protein A